MQVQDSNSAPDADHVPVSVMAAERGAGLFTTPPTSCAANPRGAATVATNEAVATTAAAQSAPATVVLRLEFMRILYRRHARNGGDLFAYLPARRPYFACNFFNKSC